MATATPPSAAPTALDPVVSNPLDQLRGVIRRYVVIEGLLSAGLFVAVWFALGLLLDFGIFKAFTWDWAVDAPMGFRAVALVISGLLLVGILVMRIGRRLNREFSYPSLAMVLERRFPKVFGDRLITAVELADVKNAARYGYSGEMIDRTIAEARDRIGTVPVRDVFNWRRLWVIGGLLMGLTAAIAVGAFLCFSIATGSVSPRHFAWRSAHVAGIFLERNVALMNTAWPRRAHLELLDFPEDGLKIAKDAPPPPVRVRAYQWVVADRGHAMGWRPMMWADVTQRLVGVTVPEYPELPGGEAGKTVDRVETVLANASARDKISLSMGAERYIELTAVMDKLNELAADPAYARSLRKLELPDAVVLSYAGTKTQGGGSLVPQRDNEYAGEVVGLKEPLVSFTVNAEDFRTPPRTIALIPPPLLSKLSQTRFEPAYLHHTPPTGQGYSWFKGRHQRLPDRDLSLTGDVSIVSAVRAGTELVLTATADKPLQAAAARPKKGRLPGQGPGSMEPVSLPLNDDRTGFSLAFRGDFKIMSDLEFDLEFTDTLGVKTVRQVSVRVTEDQPPTVELAVDVVRKVGSSYYVTPSAVVPFNPESVVRGDDGLSEVDYTYEFSPEITELGWALRSQLLMRSFLDLPGPGPLQFTGSVLPLGNIGVFQKVYREIDKANDPKSDKQSSDTAKGPPKKPVERYYDLYRGLERETEETLARTLAEPLRGDQQRSVRVVEFKKVEFRMSPNPKTGEYDYTRLYDGFEMPSELAGAGETKPRYRLELNVVAADTNFDSGPRKARNPEPIRFLVVSEADLLAEIGREEGVLAAKLKDAVDKVISARAKMIIVRSKNDTAGAGDLDILRVQADNAFQDVIKARDGVTAVLRDYRRLFLECQVNRINRAATSNYGMLANRLDRVTGTAAPALVSQGEADLDRQKLLTPLATFPEVDTLMTLVTTPLGENRKAQTADIDAAENALGRLSAELQKIYSLLGDKQNVDALIKDIEEVLRKQEKVRKELDRWHKLLQDSLLSEVPKIRGIGPVVLQKGEAKKLRHYIDWPAKGSDQITIGVTASDPSIVVPKELKLNDKDHELEFEYEIRAGQKAGDFTVTLTVPGGNTIKVDVTVK